MLGFVRKYRAILVATFGLFALLFFLGFGAGWQSVRNSESALADAAEHARIVVGPSDVLLGVKCDDGRYVYWQSVESNRGVQIGSLTDDLVNQSYGRIAELVESDTGKSVALVAGGAALPEIVNDQVKRLRKLKGLRGADGRFIKPQFRNRIVAILAGISGYAMGYRLGASQDVRCGSTEQAKLFSSEENRLLFEKLVYGEVRLAVINDRILSTNGPNTETTVVPAVELDRLARLLPVITESELRKRIAPWRRQCVNPAHFDGLVSIDADLGVGRLSDGRITEISGALAAAAEQDRDVTVMAYRCLMAVCGLHGSARTAKCRSPEAPGTPPQ